MTFSTLPPAAEPHDVYWIFDDQDRLLYIGFGRNASARINSHETLRTQSATSDEICHRAMRFEFRRYATRAEARAVEAYAIETEAPYLNHQHNKKRFRRGGRFYTPIEGVPRLPALTEIEVQRGSTPGLLIRLRCSERIAA